VDDDEPLWAWLKTHRAILGLLALVLYVSYTTFH
jgi:hypothetical protein